MAGRNHVFTTTYVDCSGRRGSACDCFTNPKLRFDTLRVPDASVDVAARENWLTARSSAGGCLIGSNVKISIVTPSFNYAHWLPDTLDSVAGQGDCGVEHVVVDDGSTDNSWDVLTAYSGTAGAPSATEPRFI